MSNYHYMVPDQQTGEWLDLEVAAALETLEDAEELFVLAKDRMLDVNNWHGLTGWQHIKLELVDKHGNVVSRTARRDDHILVHSGQEDTDWLVVDSLEYDDYPDDVAETFAIRLHYAGEAAQAADHKASATIVVGRTMKRCYVAWHGRNHTNDVGHWHNLSRPEWEQLLSALLAF